ncbi:MAG: hypothetical protein ACOX87_15040, partial [Chloroflexota bacterium]
MNGPKLEQKPLRLVRLVPVAIFLIIVFGLAAGCGPIASIFDGGTDSETRPGSPVSTPVSSSAAIEPSPTAPTPTATVVVQPTATSTPEPAVSQKQAETIVRAWFEALEAEDYQRAESLTTGDARRETQQLVETIEREADQRGVTEDIVVQRLELNPSQSQVDAGRAVRADFDIAVNAVAGPFTVQGQQFEGEATFVVGQVEGEMKITDIQDITGLP